MGIPPSMNQRTHWCYGQRTKGIVALISFTADERNNNGGTDGFTIGAPQGSMVRRISKAYALF
jgi:hypothetical protein